MVQTGKPRTKRPDGRLLSKTRRKKLAKDSDESMMAADLKITKIGSKNRKEREVVMLTKDKTNNEKLLRSLRKKMKAIVAIQEKQAKGEELDVQQLEKLDLSEDTELNLKRLEEMMAK